MVSRSCAQSLRPSGSPRHRGDSDGLLQVGFPLAVVAVVALIVRGVALAQVQGVGGDHVTALQVVDLEVTVLLPGANAALLIGYGDGVFVGLPGDQTCLVDLACGQVVGASRPTQAGSR